MCVEGVGGWVVVWVGVWVCGCVGGCVYIYIYCLFTPPSLFLLSLSPAPSALSAFLALALSLVR